MEWFFFKEKNANKTTNFKKPTLEISVSRYLPKFRKDLRWH